ncbi:MAG: hypothetical protein ATN35_05030 [Epulopiscium sp. Nele67-Bin004]|nr:MAG: hypothetical protein ATN35_05030 [Epulopiscium sp. Nele67-Bin004]
MWAKKLFSSLYISIVVRIVVSAIIGGALLIVLLFSSNHYAVRKNIEFWNENIQEIESIIQGIATFSENNQFTFKQTEDYRFSELERNTKYDIVFFSSHHDFFEQLDNLYELEMFTNGYFFEMKFVDGTGFVLVYSEEVKQITDTLIFLSFAVGISVFFILSLYLIFEKLSYLKKIEEGIHNISNNDILYKIPLEGNTELTRLASSINNMGDMLHKNIEQEREYEMNQRLLITNMSHDLKTPLTSMTGYISVAKSKLSPDHEVYPLINVAEKNGQRLEKLIADLFLYSKLLSKDISVNLQSMNINLVLKQILEIRTENIALNELDTNLTANIDPEKFHRVIDNLISNANKYGVSNKVIEIAISLKDNNIVIQIKNLTNDKLDDKIEMLTNRLYTAREDRANGSSGLGLSIVTELLKTMNASLELSVQNKLFMATIKIGHI